MGLVLGILASLLTGVIIDRDIKFGYVFAAVFLIIPLTASVWYMRSHNSQLK
jgi:hypothetical protein